ncbi:hypothetical protein IIC68_00885 [archaeon]|nr:hypothetical protein [archaeon]
MKIFKYEFPIKDSFTLFKIPEGGKILSAEMQGNKVCMWALVDPHKPDGMPRDFRIIGTGHEILKTKYLHHISTFQDGPHVWQLFEDRAYYDS